MDEITNEDWITYTLKGHDVCFALHYLAPGQVDICNFVNNSDLRGIGDPVLQFAKSEGGTQMDNYRGFHRKKTQKDMENWVIFIERMDLIDKLGMMNLTLNFSLKTQNGNWISPISKTEKDQMLKDWNCHIIENSLNGSISL